ncbi:hypothetical protein FE257_006237 [Aspergillus nanangensis]|uniref:DUF1479-domain-containing protein n=1 Tax=Aspergillus nanangensis TaxID=2582783 RepID=A0AAD4CP50_ASPNN|nr:hypothetical protein FE257_006237 [Aspergillus nanangensis]
MPATTASSFPWEQLVWDAATQEKYDTDPEYAKAKKMIHDEFGRDKLFQGWIKTCTELESLTKEIQEKKEKIFPVVEMQDIVNGCVSPDMLSNVRQVGSFIVRNVIPGQEANEIFEQLEDYVANNKDKIATSPVEQPAIFSIYNTPSQNRLRSDPRLLEVVKWANDTWDYAKDDVETSPQPLVYADRVRIRQPGAKFLGLGPHIDSGGLCRWTEPMYRSVYTDVFEGNPDKQNCYDMHKRKDADQGFYSDNSQATVLRCYQGWTALTPTAKDEGTIILYPNVSLVMAYVLLRPFFQPPEDATKIMDPQEWTYNPTGTWFPGAQVNGKLELSPASHPHMRFEENFLHIPPLEAGDTVWWHSDVCHAVDPEHNGKKAASVAYIGATPTTRMNTQQMRLQYDSMVAGLPPPDYNDGVDESNFVGFEGFKGKEDLWKTLMGY